MNTKNMQSEEAERILYAQNLPDIAELFARISDLENQVLNLENELDDAKSDSIEKWAKMHGSPELYKEFFYDCFERLSGLYQCPSITSDYDKSVILDAIEKGDE